jgi:hypothetical protein
VLTACSSLAKLNGCEAYAAMTAGGCEQLDLSSLRIGRLVGQFVLRNSSTLRRLCIWYAHFTLSSLKRNDPPLSARVVVAAAATSPLTVRGPRVGSSGSDLGLDVWLAISRALRACSRLEALDNFAWSTRALAPGVTDLNLVRCDFGDPDAAVLCALLPRSAATLRALRLRSRRSATVPDHTVCVRNIGRSVSPQASPRVRAWQYFCFTF